MYAQKIDIEVKIKHSVAQQKRRDAKIAVAQELLGLDHSQTTLAARLEAEADIIECEAGISTWELNTQAAKNELENIQGLMDELEPLRKYSHLSILDANEAFQQEEWRLELMERIENNILCHGGVPTEELRLMRSHPDFLTHLAPHIQAITNQAHSGQGALANYAHVMKLAPMAVLSTKIVPQLSNQVVPKLENQTTLVHPAIYAIKDEYK